MCLGVQESFAAREACRPGTVQRFFNKVGVLKDCSDSRKSYKVERFDKPSPFLFHLRLGTI